MPTTYEEETLTCRDCAATFAWTAGEQEFFAQKGFDKPPTRCPECRKKRRTERQGGPGGVPKPLYDITCVSCGKQGQVPFQPTSASVLCAECFRNRRTAQGSPAATETAVATLEKTDSVRPIDTQAAPAESTKSIEPASAPASTDSTP
jgi:CxxC-x17-CxxC domain-containing protein